MMYKALLTAALLVGTTMGSSAADLYGQYTRVYDRAHLASHPDQLVTAVKLRIKRPPPDSGSKYWFDLEVRVRGRNGLLKTTGLCRDEASGLRCMVECDGGGIRVEPRGDHVMMRLERIRMVTCDQDIENVMDGGEEVSGGKDDKLFRLYRVPKGN
jgi:hypothetical protein